MWARLYPLVKDMLYGGCSCREKRWRHGILVLAALIWGFAFVSQVQGMDSTTPLFFGATRFTLGSISLIPLLWFRRSTIAEQERKRRETQGKPSITLGNGAIVAMPKWAAIPSWSASSAESCFSPQAPSNNTASFTPDRRDGPASSPLYTSS